MDEIWTELCISVPTEALERASAIATAAGGGTLYIEDYSDMEQTLPEIGRVDYIDSALTNKDRTRAEIHLYLDEGAQVDSVTARLSELLRADGIEFELRRSLLRESDWSESWKRFYHAERVGERLVICPSWESFDARVTDEVLYIDPGSAFGSGTHETTRLCLRLLEDYVKPGCAVLDMGCGSGILALAALKLGAGSALGVDVAHNAVQTARENAQLNALADRFEARLGDALNDAEFAALLPDGGFSLICANIVADVLIGMASLFYNKLERGGVLLASGIIDTRADEVAAALCAAGLTELRREQDNGWFALALKKD